MYDLPSHAGIISTIRLPVHPLINFFTYLLCNSPCNQVSIQHICPSTSCIYLSIHPLFLLPSIQPSVHCIYPYILSFFSPPHSSSHMQMTLPSWEHPLICGDISGCHNAQEWFHRHVMGGDQGRCSYTPQGTGCPASEGHPAPDGSGAEAEKACPGMTVWLPLYLLILSVSLLSLSAKSVYQLSPSIHSSSICVFFHSSV